MVVVPLSPRGSRCAPPSAFGGHAPASGIVYGLRFATASGCCADQWKYGVIFVQATTGLPGKEVNFYEDHLNIYPAPDLFF
jgi:hypothetical protein